jgi:hypothetical protein
MAKIKRKIHFYELNFVFAPDFTPSDGNHFRELFAKIMSLAKTRAAIRYQDFSDEKSIFIQDIAFNSTGKFVTGKLRCVRKNILPEIMNTDTDVVRDIDVSDKEGILETTHFVIDYSKPNIKVAIEYNQFGAKIQDFTKYIVTVGQHLKVLKEIEYTPILKDELAKMRDKIQRCSEFIAKVHKDNIAKIQDIDMGMYSALETSKEHFQSDYVTISLNFDYRKRESTGAIKSVILQIISKLLQDKKRVGYFNTLKVKAENRDNYNRLEIFNLLVDKVESEIHVERRKRYRTIVSSDMFEKMQLEIKSKKFL